MAYALYRKGFLPEAGGVLDQPHTFIEACLHLDSLIAQIGEGKHAHK